MAWQQEGREPDYRFSLANERTFLAWMRTALALLAGGLLLHQFATRIQPHWVLVAASSGLAVVSALLAAGAFRQWRGYQIAMRNERPLPRSLLIPGLVLAVVVLSAALAILLLAE
jgi:putative membrane protein